MNSKFKRVISRTWEKEWSENLSQKTKIQDIMGVRTQEGIERFSVWKMMRKVELRGIVHVHISKPFGPMILIAAVKGGEAVVCGVRPICSWSEKVNGSKGQLQTSQKFWVLHGYLNSGHGVNVSVSVF